jgi:hypothetical protein
MRSVILRMRFCVEEAGVELDSSRGPRDAPSCQCSQLQPEVRGGGLRASLQRPSVVSERPRLHGGVASRTQICKPFSTRSTLCEQAEPVWAVEDSPDKSLQLRGSTDLSIRLTHARRSLPTRVARDQLDPRAIAPHIQ